MNVTAVSHRSATAYIDTDLKMHRLLFHAALITPGSHYLTKAAALGPSLMLITLGSFSAYKDQ